MGNILQDHAALIRHQGNIYRLAQSPPIIAARIRSQRLLDHLDIELRQGFQG